MLTKAQALQQLLTQSISSDEVYSIALSSAQLASTLRLTQSIFVDVLNKYLANDLDADCLEQWATLVSLNEDIDASDFEDYLLALSEPDLMGGITPHTIAKMRDIIQPR